MNNTKNAPEITLANIEMNNVVAAFNRISPNGKRVFYESYHQYPTTSSAELIASHFKGIASYKNQLIFTHTNILPKIHLGSNPGKILIANKQTSGDQDSISGIFDTNPYHYGWSHPCSAQACGSFMAMGLQETDDSNCSAEIHILDLTPLDSGAQPVSIATIPCVNRTGGQSQPSAVNGVAMTKEHGPDGRYIIAGLQGNALTIYRSVNTYLDPAIPNNPFYVVGDTIQNFPRSGAGIALITETHGAIFIIALDTDDDKGTNNSIYLYQLTISDSDVSCSAQIASKAMPVGDLSEAVRYATAPYILPSIVAQDPVCGLFLTTFATGIKDINILNTSFRWGKGLAITSPNDIEVYATDRDDLTTSRFSWPVDTKKDFSLVTWATEHQPPTPPNYYTRIWETGSTFFPETDGTWLLADFNGTGKQDDLVFIKMGTTQVEVHVATRESGYQTRIWETGSTFFPETDGTWLMADFNGTGKQDDLVFIKMGATQVEVHVATRESGYQTRIWETGSTFFPETDGTWLLADFNGTGKQDDLVFIKMGATQVEVHVATRESGYQTRIWETGSTFFPETDGTWLMADFDATGNQDDLVFLKMGATQVEVHVAG